jgi:hypothetical protein
VQQVGQPREKVVELRAESCEPRLAARQLVAERADLAHDRVDVAARGFGAADGLRALVALLAQILDARLQLLAFGLERKVALPIELEAAAREIRRDAVEVLAQYLGIQHAALA